MVNEPVKKVKIALFTQNDAIVSACQGQLNEEETALEVYDELLEAADAKLEQVDLLLIDVEHPTKSGLHWLEEIRRYPVHQEKPVVLFSAFLTDEQLEAFNKAYPNTTQLLVRVPVSPDSLESVLNYYVDRIRRQEQVALPKAVGAEELSLPEVDAEENISIQDLYERQALKESQEEAEELHEVADLAKDEIQQDEKDVETLHRYLALKDQDVLRLSEALSKGQEHLERAYALIDRLRLDLVKLTKQKEEADVKYLSLKDELERFKQKSDREKQAIIEDYQVKLAQKEILEGDHRELKNRFDAFKRRIANEVKVVRQHERELEHQIKLLRSDTEVLLSAKDQRILELTKKIESLFDRIGNIAEKLRSSEDHVTTQSDRQNRVLKALRLASSLLEEESELIKKVV